jgi:hypothetical protein
MCFNILETSTFHSSARAYPTNTPWRLCLLQRRRTNYCEWSDAFPSLLNSCISVCASFCHVTTDTAARSEYMEVGSDVALRAANKRVSEQSRDPSLPPKHRVAIAHDAFAGFEGSSVKCMCAHKCARQSKCTHKDLLPKKQIQYAPLFPSTPPSKEAGAAHSPMSPSCLGPGRTHENVNSQPSHVPRPQPFSRTSLKR